MNDVHPDVEHLSFLIGTWVGTGSGSYPTIDPFTYREESTFVARGKPYLAYEQRTHHADTGEPLHAERGFWRPVGRERLEVILAMSTGFTVIHEGVIDGSSIVLRSTSIARAPTAKQVERDERRLSVDGQALTYEHSMAAVGHPLTHHLSAVLHRASRPG